MRPAVIASAIRLSLALFALGCLGSVAFSQSTATPVQPGYVDTNNCPPGFTACWHAYTLANPLPTDAAVTVTNTNASVGTNGSAVKTSSTLAGVSDGTNQQQVVAPIGLLDGVNGNNSVSVGGYVWNGTTWDRMPGSTTGLSVREYPSLATALTGNAAGSTSAVVGTLAKAANQFTYICGFTVSAIGGTAAVGPVTVAGLTGSSMVFQLSASAAGVNFTQNFRPCIPSSAVNTDITVTTTADASASAVDVNSWGFRQ